MKKKLLVLLLFWGMILMSGCDLFNNNIPISIGATPTKEFTTPIYLKNNAIFQQKSILTINGEAEDKVIITGIIYNEAGKVIVAEKVSAYRGTYSLEFVTPRASYENYTIVLSDTVNEVRYENIRFGEVWMIAGDDLISKGFVEEEINNEDNEILDVDKNVSFLTLIDKELEWVNYETEDLFDNISKFAYDYAVSFQKSSNVPIGIVLATSDIAQIDSWLNRELIDTQLRLKEFIVNEERYIEKGLNDYSNPNTMSYFDDLLISKLNNFSIKGLIWSQGNSNLKDDFIDETEADKYYRYYLYCMNAFMQEIYKTFNSSIKIYVIQSSSGTNEYLSFLREYQAICTFNYSYIRLVPTYDLNEIIVDENDEQIITIKEVMVDKLIERLNKMVINDTYYGKKDYLSPSYSNVIVNNNHAYVEFYNCDYLREVDIIEGITVKNEFGQELEYESSIKDNWIRFNFITPTDEDDNPIIIDDYKDIIIQYAWENDATKCNLISSRGIPVSPFEIIITR